MTPYTLQKFLKSAENHCILIDNMKHNKCNNQMCEKNNAILDRKYNFLKIYSIFKLEENSQDDLNSVVHKPDT